MTSWIMTLIGYGDGVKVSQKENNLPLLPWIFISISNYGVDGYDANSPNSPQTF